MPLNPAGKDYIKATLQDLVDDAVERNNQEALAWLKEQAFAKVKDKKDSTKMVHKQLPCIRAEYATKFLGYVPKSPNSEQAQKKRKEDRENRINKMFADAEAKLNNK